MNKIAKNKFGIKCYKCYNIKMMVHYSSRTKLYEGGAKNPLKGIHEASCLCAKCQFCVFSGR